MQANWYKSRVIIGLLSLFLGYSMQGQTSLEGMNTIYRSNIKSVKFHPAGLPLAQPIIGLNSNTQLILKFDDLDADTKNYIYSVEHCQMDWSPSQLEINEYLNGFESEEIRTLDFSTLTRRQFTHYVLKFPNNLMNVTKSGNYLLHIFDDDSGEPVITRRFMVVDNQIAISADFKNPIDAGKVKTHQRIDLVVNYEKTNLINPLDNIRATIYQNGNWDISKEGLQAIFDGNNRLQFSPQDQIVFPASKEFRYVDIRSIRYRSERVQAIEEYPDGFVVFVEEDDDRSHRNYFDDQDFNGNFIIGTNDRNIQDVNADYIFTNFILRKDYPIQDGDVYLVGGFCDYVCVPENKLKYNAEEGGYTGEILLKQGVYNYKYFVKSGDQIDRYRLEGNHYETENEYTILVYYRGVTDRYDQLIGSRTVQSYTR